MDATDLTELGRALGHNTARLGLPCPEYADSAIREGYLAGKKQYPRPLLLRDADYERKLHQLKMNAYRRGRAVADDFDVAFLKRIEVDTCPVSLVALTRSTQSGTDWSVDRANNRGAYARGNLIMLATRVNQAKGALDLAAVLDRASADETEHEGLTGREWSRLASLMYGPCSLETQSVLPVRQTARLPGGLVRVTWQDAQDLMALATKDLKLRRQVVRSYQTLLGAGAGVRYEQLMERAVQLARLTAVPHDIWFDDALFGAFSAWMHHDTSDTYQTQLRQVTAKLYQFRTATTAEVAKMRFDSQGYLER
jgi:hypothetical protein